MKLLLTMEYVGTAYAGYQVQANGPTVQACLCAAAERLFGFPCDITGCSRTDSGVHARMFCATVSEHGRDSLTTTVPTERIPRALNAFLPGDIAVTGASCVPDTFHARYDVKYKEYVYEIWNSPERSAFRQDRAWHYPRPLDDKALTDMSRAADAFCGTHDFRAYMAQGSPVEDTHRTIFETEVRRDGPLVTFRVVGDGFLYHMVRIMTGTLIAVAEGKLRPEDIPAVTASGDRTRAGITAPACGLYLNRVVY